MINFPTILLCFASANVFNVQLHATSFSPTVQYFQEIAVSNNGIEYSDILKLGNPDEPYQTYHCDNYFWGRQRTENEIVQYCARMLFPREDISIAKGRIEVISEELPLVVIHNFLPNDMCDEIIQVAQQSGDMIRSTLGE